MSLDAASRISIVYEALEKISLYAKKFCHKTLEKSNKQAVNVCGIFENKKGYPKMDNLK